MHTTTVRRLVLSLFQSAPGREAGRCDKDGLLAFAIQAEVEGLTARNSVDTMRRIISDALASKAGAE